MDNRNYTEHHQSQHLYHSTQAILRHILTEFIVRVLIAERWDNSERLPRTISVKLSDYEKAFENCTDSWTVLLENSSNHQFRGVRQLHVWMSFHDPILKKN